MTTFAQYAGFYNKNVVYNPTTIDTENLHNPALLKTKTNAFDKIRIGWTGSHSTLKYLKEIEKSCKKFCRSSERLNLL